MARGPIAKSKEAATKPSTNGESEEALNRIRSFSPKESNLFSSLSAEPINPPSSKDPNTTKRVQPCGRAPTYRFDHKGLRADAAPSKVTRPKTSVSKVRVRKGILLPTKTPRDAPETIVRILIIVPTPGNI
jgi:hypothetical protein